MQVCPGLAWKIKISEHHLYDALFLHMAQTQSELGSLTIVILFCLLERQVILKYWQFGIAGIEGPADMENAIPFSMMVLRRHTTICSWSHTSTKAWLCKAISQCGYHKVREYFVYRDGHGLRSMAIHLAHHCFSLNLTASCASAHQITPLTKKACKFAHGKGVK